MVTARITEMGSSSCDASWQMQNVQKTCLTLQVGVLHSQGGEGEEQERPCESLGDLHLRQRHKKT